MIIKLSSTNGQPVKPNLSKHDSHTLWRTSLCNGFNLDSSKQIGHSDFNISNLSFMSRRAI